MDTVHRWYRREVYRWRTGASVIWSLIALPPIVTSYLFIVRLSLLHPISSLYDFFSHFLSINFCATMMCLLMIYLLLIMYNSQHFSDIPSTRLESLVSHFRGSKLLHGLIMSGGSGLLVWCMAGFIGGFYSHLTETSATGDDKYLNEHHLVFMLHAFFTGLLHHYTFYSQQKNYLQFMPVHQPKVFHIKTSLHAIFTNSFTNTLSAIKFFYVWYFLFGDIPKTWIISKLNLHERSLPAISSLYGMLDPPLFLHLLLSGTLLRFLWNISHLLYKLHNTEPFAFPIETNHEAYRNKCLHNALACDSAPLVQYLAFMDLHRLSEHDASRRSQLFSLSQPGGHPHNWSRICASSIGLIDAFCSTLQQHNWLVAAQHRVNGDAVNPTTSGITNTTSPNGTQKKQIVTPYDPMSHFFQKMYENVKTKPFICFLLNKLPDSDNRRLFASSQLHIWAIDALSNLVCASYKEDSYGIVQRSLPTVLVSLLNLHETIEKYFKVTSTASRRQRDLLGSHDAGLRHNVRHIIKTSIYRIVDMFGQHLQEFSLSDEHLCKLRQFQQFRE